MTGQKFSFYNNQVDLVRVLVKTAVLFLLANLIFVWVYPMPALGQISAYNHIFPGRLRLPYGDNPEKAYNLSLFNLDAMFASHELARRPKEADEFRVIFIGDSSTWGYLLENKDTLTGKINAANLQLPDGRKIHSYNLGYPVMSLTKDLTLLSYAMRYQPDLIIWPFTLESFPIDKQLFPPLLQNNSSVVQNILDQYQLKVGNPAKELKSPSFLDKTIIGSRRSLADLARLQIYGILWSATGIDQDIPEDYPSRQEDLESKTIYHGLNPGQMTQKDLALDVLASGIKMAGETPVILINEPMFISQGKNSDIRYNFYYPRWAYDTYRHIMSEASSENKWAYYDYWNLVPSSEFTNSAVHMSPQGTSIFANQIIELILQKAEAKHG